MVSRRAQRRIARTASGERAERAPSVPTSPIPMGPRTYSVVPVMKTGETGPVAGSQGDYDAVVILGVPGAGTLLREANMNPPTTDGDSLISAGSNQLSVAFAGERIEDVSVEFLTNSQGRLGQLRFSHSASSFQDMQTFAHNLAMPLVSRLAFETDTALEIVATVLHEKSTSIRSVSGVFAGAVAPLSELNGLSTPEIRLFFSAYREGLSSNSPLYQALSYWKVIEGVKTFDTRRRRNDDSDAISRPDPYATKMPRNFNEALRIDEWSAAEFQPYWGKSFGEVKKALNEPIRNAIAHITPGRELRSFDRFKDVDECRRAIPLLKYMARVLIQNEVELLDSGS
jgi:hypothetical protein